MTSSGRRTFLPITFVRNELETWGWCHSVRLVKAYRLICHMTYLGHTVTLTWRDLRSNFKIDLSRIKKHMDRSGLTRGKWWCHNYSTSLSSWEVIHEKSISPKKRILSLWWPLVLTVLGWPPIWAHRSLAEFRGYHLAILQMLLASMVIEIIASFCENSLILRKFDLFWPPVTSNLTWSKMI